VRILLTGVSGQVGFELARTLAPHGEILAADRSVLDLAGPPDRIRATVRRLAPDLIINPAAHTAVDRAESEPALARAINATAPAVLAEEAAALGIALIHFSTDYVFDGAGTRPYREEDPCAPASVYGQTKREGELAIAAAGPRHYILRTSWVYGLRGRNFLATMARLAGERPELRVVDDQIGAPTTSPAIARATAALVAQITGETPPPAGIYHLSCAGQTSWCGFARAIVQRLPAVCAALNLPLPAHPPAVTGIRTADYPTPARRPAFSLLSNEKLRRTTGIALPDWADALDELLAG
jgi:dTDP-4-dehydrorhamnose reductase